jgi:hypothetical protein
MRIERGAYDAFAKLKTVGAEPKIAKKSGIDFSRG